MFFLMDIAYSFGFIPGIIRACFGNFWIVGPMTLALLPMAFLFNWQMCLKGREMFSEENLMLRANISGFFILRIRLWVDFAASLRIGLYFTTTELKKRAGVQNECSS
ncbi:hypothetical protein [Polynucleobacter necessarius]|uniref:hypothetical protein n=1 Tax=Polynucleobacter necessarius TaxID=576610 RepID=UPI001E5558A3|nr:hypothetical protein [Polynucleobacter necessarius]